MTQTRKTNVRNAERGVALLIAIFTLMLLTAIGFGMILLTNTDTSISSNFRDEQTAFFGAKAGMEEVRDRFRGAANNPLQANLPTGLLGSANGLLYVLNPTNGEADTPWVTTGNAYPDDEICAEVTRMGVACGANPPVTYTTAQSSASYRPATGPLSWKWTRVTLKTNLTSSGTTNTASVDGNVGDTNEVVCWTGAVEMSTPLVGTAQASCTAANPNYQPVYVLTTLAVTPSLSRRMIQSEAAATTFPTLPGPLILDGPAPVFNPPNSNALNVSGTDHSSNANPNGPPGYNCPAPVNQPALGATSAADATNLANGLPKPGDFVSGTTPTPSVGNVSGALGNLDTVGGLENLVSEVTMVAGNFGNVYPSNPVGGIANPGTAANPVVNVVQGNLTLPAGWSGAGILLVEGTLTMNGNPNYDGLILVIGQGALLKNGGGNGTLDGSILVANLYDSHGNLLPATSAPGTPTMTWNGGGTANYNYDSCWSNALSNSLPYRIVGVREMIK